MLNEQFDRIYICRNESNSADKNEMEKFFTDNKTVIQNFRMEVTNSSNEQEKKQNDALESISSAIQIQHEIFTEDNDVLDIQLSDDSEEDSEDEQTKRY